MTSGLESLEKARDAALTAVRSRIEKWQTYARDYEDLLGSLSTISDKTSYSAMVPFGKLAFMPGNVIHTNEILVLLGDGWFVERSAKQAVAIVQRGLDAVKRTLDQFHEEEQLIATGKQFTSEYYQDLALDSDDNAFEIKEDFDEQTEARWRLEHAKRVRDYNLSKERAVDSNNTATTPPSDENLFSILDQLETEEDLSEETVEPAAASYALERLSKKKRVSFASDNNVEEEFSNDREDEFSTQRITFGHTDTNPLALTSNSELDFPQHPGEISAFITRKRNSEPVKSTIIERDTVGVSRETHRTSERKVSSFKASRLARLKNK